MDTRKLPAWIAGVIGTALALGALTCVLGRAATAAATRGRGIDGATIAAAFDAATTAAQRRARHWGAAQRQRRNTPEGDRRWLLRALAWLVVPLVATAAIGRQQAPAALAWLAVPVLAGALALLASRRRRPDAARFPAYRPLADDALFAVGGAALAVAALTGAAIAAAPLVGWTALAWGVAGTMAAAGGRLALLRASRHGLATHAVRAAVAALGCASLGHIAAWMLARALNPTALDVGMQWLAVGVGIWLEIRIAYAAVLRLRGARMRTTGPETLMADLRERWDRWRTPAGPGNPAGLRTLVVALAVTLVAFAAELVLAMQAASAVLVADAVLMLVDAIVQGALLALLVRDRRRRGPGMPAVWEMAAPLLGGALLVAVAVGTIASASVVAGGTPEPLAMIAVGAGGAMVNLLLVWLLRRWRRLSARVARATAVSDLGGSVAAIVAGTLVLGTGARAWDTVGALVLCAGMVVTGVRLLRGGFRRAPLPAPQPGELDLRTRGTWMRLLALAGAAGWLWAQPYTVFGFAEPLERFSGVPATVLGQLATAGLLFGLAVLLPLSGRLRWLPWLASVTVGAATLAVVMVDHAPWATAAAVTVASATALAPTIALQRVAGTVPRGGWGELAYQLVGIVLVSVVWAGGMQLEAWLLAQFGLRGAMAVYGGGALVAALVLALTLPRGRSRAPARVSPLATWRVVRDDRRVRLAAGMSALSGGALACWDTQVPRAVADSFAHGAVSIAAATGLALPVGAALAFVVGLIGMRLERLLLSAAACTALAFGVGVFFEWPVGAALLPALWLGRTLVEGGTTTTTLNVFKVDTGVAATSAVQLGKALGYAAVPLLASAAYAGGGWRLVMAAGGVLAGTQLLLARRLLGRHP